MKAMTCREFDEIVHEVVRMELLDVSLREAAREHSMQCNDCSERLAEAVLLAEITEASAERDRSQQTPTHVESALLGAFRDHHRRASWRRKMEWVTVGAIAAMVLFFIWNFPGRGKGRPNPSPRRDISSQSKAPLDASATTVPEPKEGVEESVEVADASIGAAYVASDFVPVPFSGAIAAEDPGMVVRVQLTRASLAQLGYPVAEAPDEDLVLADVLVGEDGWPRGVKLVQ